MSITPFRQRSDTLVAKPGPLRKGDLPCGFQSGQDPYSNALREKRRRRKDQVPSTCSPPTFVGQRHSALKPPKEPRSVGPNASCYRPWEPP
jgi:hypothetical protein